MKENELRIGNLVYNVMGQPINVTWENIKWASDIAPIPLTPQRLLKAGAINKYGNEFFIGKLKFTYEINELSQFVRFHYSGKVAYLQYVHELQNLYFSICRNELEITLS